MLLRDSHSSSVFFSPPLPLPLILLHLHLNSLFFPATFPPFVFLCVGLAWRADLNECEMVPVPCAYRCVNSPGSYKCLCPPGLLLLGDGKSCAGLERLPGYESVLYGYRTSQSSSDRSSYQQRYHSMASQSYHSYVPIRESYPANRPHSYLSRGRRATNTCPPGFRAVKGWCLGNYKSN